MTQRRDEEIRTLRKSGQLDEAFDLAQQSLEEAKDNIWLKREIGWVCYGKAKYHTEAGEVEQAMAIFETIAQLGFATSEETLLAKNLTWMCATIAKHFANTYKGKDRDEEFRRNAKPIVEILTSLIELMQRIPIEKPSDGYSLFMYNLHKLLKDRPGYATVFKSVGFDSFSEEDYRPFKTESGRSIIPLAEQIYLAYTKALLSGFNHNYNAAKHLAEEFLPVLNAVKLSNPEYIWTDYNITKLLIALNRMTDAKQSCIDFIKRKSKEFWAWECLGQIYEASDVELSMACYCMALSCEADDDFLVSVMEGAANVFVKAGCFNEARTEVDRVVKIRMDKWHRIPPSLAEMMHTDWYSAAQSLKSNKRFYDEHRDTAMGLVFGAQKPIVITHLNVEKKFANYITDDGKVGFFNYARLKNRGINENKIYLVTFVKEATSGPSNVLSVKEVAIDTDYPTLRRMVSGAIKIIASGVGFVENCFVPSRLIQQCGLTNGQTIKVTAIRTYDRKKSALSWTVVKIE